MFENLNPSDDDKPISLGLAAGEERKQQKDQALKVEKTYQDLKSSQKFYLFKVLLSVGLLVFSLALSIESLFVSGIVPGRVTKPVVVVRKSIVPIKNSRRKFYNVYWKESNSETEQEKSMNVPSDDWATIREGQEVQLVWRPFYKDWAILTTNQTNGSDLTIKLSGCILSAFLIFYFLRKWKSAKQEILETEHSKYKINF